MGTDVSERKDLMEAVRDLLRSTEELKAYIPSLVRDQKAAFKILKSHEKAISHLMDILIGTQRAHKERLHKLELDKRSTEVHISKVEERLEAHEKAITGLKRRFRARDFKELRKFIKKLEKKAVSTRDVKFINEIISLYPDNEYLWVLKASLLHVLLLGKKIKRIEAQNFIEEAVSKHPNNASLWYYRGLILYKNFAESLKSFDKGLTVVESEDRLEQHLLYFSRASLLAKNKKLEPALESAIKSLEARPECATGWTLKGRILLRLDRISQALGCFEKAIKLDDKQTKAWVGKGIALSALGPDSSDEAISSFDRAIEIDKTCTPAYVIKADLLVEKEEYKDALQSFNKALELRPKDPCIWCKRAAVLDSLGETQKALKSYEKALEVGPPKECALIFNNYAYFLYENKQYEDGMKFARKAVKAEPENAMFLDTLACNLQALSQDKEALKVFSKALKFKKSDEEITWDALATLYEKMGKTRKSEEAYQKATSTKTERSGKYIISRG